MKKLMILICAALLALMPQTGALAGTTTDTAHAITLQPGNKQYQINQQEFTMPAVPFSSQGRIYVPVDFLGSALGTGDQDVNWRVGTDEISLVVPARAGDLLEIKLQPHGNQLVIDYLKQQTGAQALEVTHSKTITMDVTPLVQEGQFYLPVRWVAQACGYTVTWDSNTQRALLAAPGTSVPSGTEKDDTAPGVLVNTKEIKSSDARLELNLELPVISGLVDQALQEQINSQIQEQALQTKAELEQNYAEIAENAETFEFPLHTHQLFVTYDTYTSGNIISLVVETYQYSGGAHGGTIKDFYILDTKNGRILTLPDLFKADAHYIATINQEIQRQMAAQLEGDTGIYYFEGEMGFQSIDSHHPFYIKDKQLILHFGQYEIAPYAAGMPEFALPLAMLTEQLQPAFLQLLASEQA